MSATCSITNAGKSFLAGIIVNGAPTPLTGMAFGLTTFAAGATPPMDFAFAEGEVKYLADDLTAGLLSEDVAVWSAVLPPTVGDFTFNTVALMHDDTVVAVVYQNTQYKTATTGFVTGNTIIKNIALQVAGIGTLTQVTVAAGTWQQDLSALYAAKSHNHDLLYAAIGHNHDLIYDPINSAKNHNDSLQAHNRLFADIATALAGKAASDHTHLYMVQPDWAGAVSCNFNTQYTATKSGYIGVYATCADADQRHFYLILDGVTHKIARRSGFYNGDLLLYPILAGNVWKIEVKTVDGAIINTLLGDSYIKFIPAKEA